MYTERNVALSGIHTHSGPGGYFQYVLYEITSLGFVKQSYDAVVNGIVEVRSGLQPHLSLPLKYSDLAFSRLLKDLDLGLTCCWSAGKCPSAWP